MQCISPLNLVCVALSIRKLWRRSQILNLGHVTLTTPSLGANLLCFGNEQVDEHVMVSVCTKYEVSIFGHSNNIKGDPKFRKWSRDLSHAPFGVKFSYFDKGLHKMY